MSGGQYRPPLPDAAALADLPTVAVPRQRPAEAAVPPADRVGHRRAGGGAGGRAARQRTAPRGRRRVVRWTAAALGLLLLAGCGTALYAYRHFNGNIASVDVHLGSEAERPKPVGDAVNILVLGTDSRAGLGSSYGDAGSLGHADTTILFHVAKDRSNATAVSIPRDLMVTIPDCQTGGRRIPGQTRAMFNTSLGQAGRDPGCIWKTTERLTGVRMDHFVMLDFDAVKTLSTAVGGVEVCAAKDINDPDSHLRMSKGRHVVQGDDALAFVRTRHAVGFGGDLTRIPLQQQFISAMIRKLKSGDALTDPVKLFQLADAATKALTVDKSIGSVDRLKDLALDLGAVDTKHITFATVPVLDDPRDDNRLILKQSEAGRLFALVAADRSLTDGPSPAASDTPSAPASSAPASSAPASSAPTVAPGAAPVDPKDVRVTVRNGSGVTGQAQQAVGRLRSRGFTRAAVGGAGDPVPATSLSYAPARAGQAAALAAALGLPATVLQENPQAGARDPLTLVLGRDVNTPGGLLAPAGPTEAPKDLQRVQADDTDVCAT